MTLKTLLKQCFDNFDYAQSYQLLSKKIFFT